MSLFDEPINPFFTLTPRDFLTALGTATLVVFLMGECLNSEYKPNKNIMESEYTRKENDRISHIRPLFGRKAQNFLEDHNLYFEYFTP